MSSIFVYSDIVGIFRKRYMKLTLPFLDPLLVYVACLGTGNSFV